MRSHKGSPPPAHAPGHYGREHDLSASLSPDNYATIACASRAQIGRHTDAVGRARRHLGTSRRATRRMARSSPSWTKWITRTRRGRVRGERGDAYATERPRDARLEGNLDSRTSGLDQWGPPRERSDLLTVLYIDGVNTPNQAVDVIHPRTYHARKTPARHRGFILISSDSSQPALRVVALFTTSASNPSLRVIVRASLNDADRVGAGGRVRGTPVARNDPAPLVTLAQPHSN